MLIIIWKKKVFKNKYINQGQGTWLGLSLFPPPPFSLLADSSQPEGRRDPRGPFEAHRYILEIQAINFHFHFTF